MASFRTEDFIFIHFPKTGGMWFWNMCIKQNLSPIVELPPKHRSHRPAVFFKNWSELPWIAFYRNPLDWYGSLWSYHMKMDFYWNPKLKEMSFHNFVELCLVTSPMSKGFHNMVYDSLNYLQSKSGEIKLPPPLYLIQYERMFEDLPLAFKAMGIDVTAEQLKATPRRNGRRMKGFRGGMGPQFPPPLSPALREKIMKADKSIFDLMEKHDEIVEKWNVEELVIER